MKNYTVTWTTEVVATTPDMAAQQAAQLMRDPQSRVCIIHVKSLETGDDGLWDADSKPPRKIL